MRRLGSLLPGRVAPWHRLPAPWAHSRPYTPQLLARCRHLSSGSSSATTGLATAAITVGGVAAFVAFDKGMGRTLQQAGIAFPSSVACIIVGGAVSLHPRAGPALQRVLGPGASWLRAGLPVFLCPPVLAPIVMDNPGAEYVGKMVAVAFVGLFSTMAVVGHLAARLMPTGSAGISIVHETAMVEANAAAARALTSGRVAAGLAVAGCLITAVLLQVQSSSSSSSSSSSTSTSSTSTSSSSTSAAVTEAWAKAPGYTGLALAAYVAGSWLPPTLKLICPPTFFAAGSAIVLTVAVDGRREVSTWLDGAVRETPFGGAICTFKTIILARQARDKHVGNVESKSNVSAGCDSPLGCQPGDSHARPVCTQLQGPPREARSAPRSCLHSHGTALPSRSGYARCENTAVCFLSGVFSGIKTFW